MADGVCKGQQRMTRAGEADSDTRTGQKSERKETEAGKSSKATPLAVLVSGEGWVVGISALFSCVVGHVIHCKPSRHFCHLYRTFLPALLGFAFQ